MDTWPAETVSVRVFVAVSCEYAAPGRDTAANKINNAIKNFFIEISSRNLKTVHGNVCPEL
jgi:hypothetical protein